MTLFPNKLNEDYKGSRLAIYGLYPIFALYIFRSLVHFLSENAGLVGIATIKELPIIDTIDPNNLVYLFASLWGCLLYTSPSPRDKRQSRMPSSA